MPKRLNEPLVVYSALVLIALAGLWLPWLSPVSAGVAAIIGLSLVAFFHELGHGLVAVSQGYRFLFLVVGPLRIEETAAGSRVAINRFWGYAGGVCAQTPERVPTERLRRAHMLVLLAGPLVNLSIGVAVFAIGGRHVPFPAALAGAASLGMGVASLIPSRQGAVASDGLGFSILRRGGRPAELYLHRLRLTAAILSPARPAEWPSADLEALAQEMADRPLSSTHREWQSQLSDRTMLYYNLIDRGETERAGEILDVWDAGLAKNAASVTVQSAIVTRAFHLAWYEKDPTEARCWLAIIKRATPPVESDWQRARAAICFAEGDLEGARKALAEATRGTSHQFADAGISKLEQQWLAELAAQLQ